MRTKLSVMLVAALALSVLLLTGGASAQRQGNDNAPGGSKSKRVVGVRSSDTGTGSRVTITADDSLKDYSAYRSGDRFYVVLPKAAAGARGGGSGKGYTDMQVQQRGDSVVLSYRVQPGAKPRVEQKFNRLDVVFDVAGEAPQQAATNNAARQQPTTPAENRNPSGQQNNQTAASTPNTTPTPERRQPTPEEIARTQAANAAAANTPASVAVQPTTAFDPAAPNPASTSIEPTPSPASTPAPATEIAQAQPPTVIAPITTNQPAQAAQTGTSLGTYVVQNWLSIFVVLLVVGLGLVFVARRTAAKPAPVESSDDKSAARVEEPRASRAKETTAQALRDASAAAAQPSTLDAAKASTVSTPEPVNTPEPISTPEPVNAAEPVVSTTETVNAAEVSEASDVDVKPLAAATALAGGAALAKSRKQSRKEARQEAKRKKKGPHAEEPAHEATPVAPVAQEPVVEEPAIEESTAVATFAEETAAVAPVVEEPTVQEEPVVEASPVAEVVVAEETKVVEEVAVETPSVEEPVREETAEVAEVVAEPETAEELVAPVVESVEPEQVEVEESSLEAPSLDSSEVQTREIAPVEVDAANPFVLEEGASGPLSWGGPAPVPEPDRVLDETRNLLEGETYDRAVVGSNDAMARQMVAAELLSALAGRHALRRERAGAAFVAHGYFDETARDLREADAPAERSAAARSLAILGDRKATPLLIAALEDPVSDVRRAAVEALGALRDPSAVEPLEALLEREKQERNRIPPRVIRTVIEICREGFAETTTAETQTAIPAVEVSEPAVSFKTETAPTVEAADVVDALPTVESAPVEEVAVEPEPEALVEEIEVEPVIAPEPAAEATGEPARVPEPVHTEEPVAAVEPHELEVAFAEPEAVAEPGVEPFIDLAEEPAAVEEVNVEPVARQDEEVSTAGTFEFDMGRQESVQPQLFHADADEVTREVEPVASDASEELTPPVGEAAAGEWFNFDINEMGGEEQSADSSNAAPEQFVTEQAAPESIFESSSGEAFTAPAAEVEEVAPVAEAQPEATREIETAEVTAEVTAEATPVSRELVPAGETHEKGLAPFDELSTVPASIQQRLVSSSPAERAAAIVELSHVDTDEAFQQICAAFDDPAKEVRAAAARALHELRTDRAESFTRALREATPERRREIGAAISSSGLAAESISQLTGESRERTYEAFSLLFLMAKAGEVQPLLRAIEAHPSNEVRLAVVKLLALSGQKEVLPAFRRLAVRGSLPTEVRSAVMEAIYQISSSQPTHA